MSVGAVHKPDELVTDWQVAIRYLEAGNRRFREGKPVSHVLTPDGREILKRGQKPFAVILSCADSRVAPEIFFDEGMGDIFVIRNAGNTVDKAVLGSIEYAVSYLQTPLVAVVGHSNCAAVAAAMSGVEYSDNLRTIMDAIRPAVAGCSDVDDAIRANVNSSVAVIRGNPVVKQRDATVMAAYYDMGTGAVTFW